MDIATLVNLEKKDRRDYGQGLKHYRDLKNALEASKLEGEKLGMEKGRRAEKDGVGPGQFV